MVVWKRRFSWGMGVLVTEELCDNVVDARRVCNIVMAVVLVFEGDVLSMICGYSPHSGINFEEQ